MFDHRVSKHCLMSPPVVSPPQRDASPRNVRLVPRYWEFVTDQPLGHVIVLPAPAPVLVGEPVDQVEVLDTHGGDATKQIFVGQQVLKLVHRYRHVSRLVRAGVEITVVLG